MVTAEYFWADYDFSLIYNPVAEKVGKQAKSEKLIYVACSRTKKDLACIRVLTADEEESFKNKFPQAEKVEVAEEISEPISLQGIQ